MAISETIGYGLNHLMARASDPVHTDITDVSKAFAVLGFFITCYGLMSYVVKERLYLSEPLIALTVG
jgi:sodium/hydrogen antiporter